jgi:hypothetical protein
MRDAEGVKGSWCGDRGVSPSPVARGLCPSPKFFCIFHLKIACFNDFLRCKLRVFFVIEGIKSTECIVINYEYDYLKQTANLFFCNLSTMNN